MLQTPILNSAEQNAMTDRIFVDSNVWVYLFKSDDIEKNIIAKRFFAENTDNGIDFFVSYQVINEVVSILKNKKGFNENQLQFFIETMLELSFVQNFSRKTLITASELRKNYSVSYWDSLIVSAAISADCQYIITEDMQHNQNINGTTIMNIFKKV